MRVPRLRRRHVVAAATCSVLLGGATHSAVLQTGPPTCAGLAATIVGTDADETLNGNAPAYDVDLGPWQATISSSASRGTTWICGEAGTDILAGAAGNDILEGGADSDTLPAARATTGSTGGGGLDRRRSTSPTFRLPPVPCKPISPPARRPAKARTR